VPALRKAVDSGVERADRLRYARQSAPLRQSCSVRRATGTRGLRHQHAVQATDLSQDARFIGAIPDPGYSFRRCSACCTGQTEEERARWIMLRCASRRPLWPQSPSTSSTETGSASRGTFLPSAPYSIMKPLGDQA
jgi:hypothetical protein